MSEVSPSRRRQPRGGDGMGSRKSPHWFSRELNGSVRFRINLPPDLASLIEEAAGDTPLMVYIQRVLRERAKYHISKREQVTGGRVPRDVPDDEDFEEAEDNHSHHHASSRDQLAAPHVLDNEPHTAGPDSSAAVKFQPPSEPA